MATVREGEQREGVIANVIAAWKQQELGGAFRHETISSGSDIDRLMYRDDKPTFYFEIKERTCSLNGYSITMFPFAKIDAARAHSAETGLSVHFFLKFTDCLALHTFNPALKYQKGEAPFAPQYRPQQNTQSRQEPVHLPVEELLEVVPLTAELRGLLAFA